MQNFEYEAWNAASFDGTVSSSRFSWSFSRERLFRCCERACFIGYYLSQGGWDLHAHPLIRSAYVEKYSFPFSLWLTRTFQAGVTLGFQKAVNLPQEKRKRAFSSGCLRFLSKSLFDLEFSLENGEYLTDPKKPVIRECLDGKLSRFPEYRQLALDSFGTAFATFTSSALFQEILALDTVDFRFDDQLLSFLFEQWPVWFSPGLVFFCRGRFNMFLCAAEGMESDEKCDDLPDPVSVSAALFALHVRSQWKKQSPASFVFRFGREAAGVEEISPAPKIRTMIRTGAGEMFSRIRSDGSVSFLDFPKTTDPDRCANCLYARTCHSLDEWIGSRHS